MAGGGGGWGGWGGGGVGGGGGGGGGGGVGGVGGGGWGGSCGDPAGRCRCCGRNPLAGGAAAIAAHVPPQAGAAQHACRVCRS